MNNLFALQEDAASFGDESFTVLAGKPEGTRIERIVSRGHATPEGVWYDQEEDEWVAVLEGTARLAYGDGSVITLRKGDFVLIPRRVKHRVAHTSDPCIWLAVHGALGKR